MTEALYLPVGDAGRYRATDLTAGPWDERLQHGGPPSALIARECEQLAAAWPFTTVRLVSEILGPVPVGEVSVSASVARGGRSVELLDAQLEAGGRVAIRARAWRIRRQELDLPDAAGGAPPPAMPAEDTPLPPGFPAGFVPSLQMRVASGSWFEPGPATVWARMTVPLVAGETPSGLQRVVALADCGNGVSSVLPLGTWMFINPDLTVHVSRYPQGEWTCLEATTTTDPAGFGLAHSTLYDEQGEVARGAQSLYLARR